MDYDVVVIGAGVVGAMITRELSRYQLRVCCIERESDVAMGVSKANSAIIHAGYDAKPGTLKAKFNVLGNSMMEQIARELDVPFQRIGSLVLAFDEKDMGEIELLYENGRKNDVPGIQLFNYEQVKAREPSISTEVKGALFAPTAGIICPYELTIALAENAVQNGAELLLEHEVKRVVLENGMFRISTSKRDVVSKYLVNAAGLYADTISAMLGENIYSITPRKGEYVLLDKSQGSRVKTVIFQPPSKLGKGILVTPTVDGNLLLGPSAVDIEDKEDTTTTAKGLQYVIRAAKRSIPDMNLRDTIASFAGLRAVADTDDFVIQASENAKGFIHVGGIQSPGLTASPQIARHVLCLLKRAGVQQVEKQGFEPMRKPVKRFREMTDEERNEAIRCDPRFGNIVCRCEMVTEAEIVDCIQRPVGARNVDAVKRRTRSGMGRCQGGFCAPRVVELLSRELGIPMNEVTKKGGASVLLTGKTKQ